MNTEVERGRTSTPRLVDNFMDFSHFPWVHTGTFGAGQDPFVPKLELASSTTTSLATSYEVIAAIPTKQGGRAAATTTSCTGS